MAKRRKPSHGPRRPPGPPTKRRPTVASGRAIAAVQAFLEGRDIAPRLLDKLRSANLPEWFTRRDILQRGWQDFFSPEVVAAALRFLAEDGFLKSDGSPTGGRPTIRYKLLLPARSG